MKKKYLYNGQLYTREQIESSAASNKLSFSDYVSKAGIQEVDENYDYNGKSYGAEQIAKSASDNGLSFDDYLNKANITASVKKKEVSLGEAGAKAVLPGTSNTAIPTSQLSSGIGTVNDDDLSGDENKGLYSKADPKKYETVLSKDKEKEFQEWFEKYHNKGEITDGDYKFYKENGYGYDYDFRAAFIKSGNVRSDGSIHWTDYGKKPNHPTFSNESKYNNVDGQLGGAWDGDKFIPPKKEVSLGQVGAKSVLPGTSNTAIPTSQLGSGIGTEDGYKDEPVSLPSKPLQVGSPNDIFEGMRQQAAKSYTPSTPPEKKEAVGLDKYQKINIDGKSFPVAPQFLPEGYTKDEDGVVNYLADFSTKLISEKDPAKRYEIKKSIINVSSPIALKEDEYLNERTTTQEDLLKAESLIGVKPEIDVATLNKLKEKRKEVIQSQRPAFESDKNNWIENRQTGEVRFNESKFKPDTKEIDLLIRKVGNSIQKESDVTKEGVPVLSGDTRSDLNAFLNGGIAGTVKNYSERFHPENLNNSFFTGLEALQYTDEVRYGLLKKRLTEGKTLASTVVSELTNSGAGIIRARQLEGLANKSIDVDSYIKKEQEVSEQVNKNLLGRPDILQKVIGATIGEYRSEALKAQGLAGEWMVSDKEIDAIPEDYWKSKGIDINIPEVKEAIKNIKKNEGFLPFDNAVPKDGLLREILKGASGPIRGVSNFFGNIGASDNELRLQKELDPISNYTRQRTEYFDKHYGKLADAFNGLGQFATQYLLMEAGVGAFKGIGLAAGGAEVAAITAPFKGGTRIGNVILDKASMFSQVAVPYLQSYDDYYKSALEKTDNQLAAKVSAFVNAGMEAASEQLLPNLKYGRQIVKDFSGNALNLRNIAKIFEKGAFDDASAAALKTTIKEGLQQSMKVLQRKGLDLTKESFEEVPVALTNFITDAMLNPQSVEGRDVFGEMKDAFMAGLVSFSIPSVLGAAGGIKAQFKNNTTQQDALMVAARNRSDVMDAIHTLHEDGDLTKDEMNHKIQVLNTATESLKQIPGYLNGGQMSEKDKVKYLGLTVQEKFIKKENEESQDEAVIDANKNTLSEINKKKVGIILSSATEADWNKRINSEKDESKKKNLVAMRDIWVAEEGKENAGKIFSDFDDTLWDTKNKKLTPLGEEMKQRIDNGENVTILTAREATQENNDFIASQLGISSNKIIQGLSPEGKASMLVPGATYYENDKAALESAKGRLGVNIIDSKKKPADVVRNPLTKEDKEIDRAIEEKQRTAGLSTTPDLALSDKAKIAMDNINAGQEISDEDLGLLSSELYSRYKALSQTVGAPTRRLTIKQQQDAIADIENKVKVLEESKTEDGSPVKIDLNLFNNKSEVNADNDLLEKIREKASPESKAGDLQYFIDKAAEDPVAFMDIHGRLTTKGLLERVPTEKLKSNRDYLVDNFGESESSDYLSLIISERAAKQAPATPVSEPAPEKKADTVSEGDVANQEADIEVARQDAIIEAGKPIIQDFPVIEMAEPDTETFTVYKDKAKTKVDAKSTRKNKAKFNAEKNAFDKRKQQLADRYEALKQLIDC